MIDFNDFYSAVASSPDEKGKYPCLVDSDGELFWDMVFYRENNWQLEGFKPNARVVAWSIMPDKDFVVKKVKYEHLPPKRKFPYTMPRVAAVLAIFIYCMFFTSLIGLSFYEWEFILIAPAVVFTAFSIIALSIFFWIVTSPMVQKWLLKFPEYKAK